jgi:hypothetical protein
MIAFDGDELWNEVHMMSVDCVNFFIKKLHNDQSTIWFDPESHSSDTCFHQNMILKHTKTCFLQVSSMNFDCHCTFSE